MAQFGAPNFLSVIDAYEAGSRRREKNALAELSAKARELTGPAIGGNKNALAELFSVDADRGMKVQQFTDDQKKQFVQDFTRQAYAATTPEQWSSMIDRYKQQGRTFDPGEEDFANRDALIARGLDVGDMMGLDLRKQEAARAQRNADRSFNADEAYRAQQIAFERQKLAASTPDLVEIYDDKTGQPYKAKFNAQTGGFDRVGGVKAPSGTSLEVGPDGAVSFTQGMGKITEGQGKDISYLNRMLTAAPILDKNDEALTSLGESVAGRAPLGIGNYAKSAQFQQAEQAGRNFLTALLRKESGAQIPPSEERSYGDIFLPRPGDKKEVIAQKREARRQAAIGIKMGLPAHIIKGMVQQGVDFTTLDAPERTGQPGKSDQMPMPGAVEDGYRFKGGNPADPKNWEPVR